MSENSELRLPGNGVAGCKALTKLLLCYDSKITATSSQDNYTEEDCPPAAISNLICLAHLTVSMAKDKVDLAQFQAVSSLRRLHLILQGTKLITGGILSKLTELKITASAEQQDSTLDLLFRTAITVGVKWKCLHSLESVTITGPAILSNSLLQLCSLPKLRTFALASRQATKRLCSI